jgi:inorganic triphosphatase YgiF
MPRHASFASRAQGARHRACARARVVTTYHDTPTGAAPRRRALRVRRRRPHWKLSIKGPPCRRDAWTIARPELEWKADGPTIDLVRLMTTPWASFAKALRKGKLAPVFSTDVQRTTLPLAFGDGTMARSRSTWARSSC